MKQQEIEIPNQIEQLSFEDACKKLEDIVRELEQGQITLEQSVTIYMEGCHLRRHCQNLLNQAQKRIDMIVEQDNKVEKLEPFQGE